MNKKKIWKQIVTDGIGWQLAELKRMCRRGYKIFSNQQEKKKKGED